MDLLGVVTVLGQLGSVKRKSDQSELQRRDVTLTDQRCAAPAQNFHSDLQDWAIMRTPARARSRLHLGGLAWTQRPAPLLCLLGGKAQGSGGSNEWQTVMAGSARPDDCVAADWDLLQIGASMCMAWRGKAAAEPWLTS